MDTLASALETHPTVEGALDSMGLGFLHFDPRDCEDSQDPNQHAQEVGVEDAKNTPLGNSIEYPSNASDPPPATLPSETSCPATLEDQRKRELHRESSRKWHEKYVKKGVLRTPPAENSAPAEEASSSKPLSSLQKARDEFISSWIERSDMPKSKERFQAACKAWMDSSIRADIIAGRAGVQK